MSSRILEMLPEDCPVMGIVQQRVTELEDEIDLNFAILMTITSMMCIVLIMTLHAGYISCKQRVDSALTTPIKPVASCVPIVRLTPDAPPAIEIQPIEMDIKPTWVERPYKCRN